MSKAHSLLDLDDAVVRVFNTELKQQICQFTSKHKAANILGVQIQNVKNTIQRDGKLYCDREGVKMWIAPRMRKSDDTLPTDPSIIEFLKIVAEQKKSEQATI